MNFILPNSKKGFTLIELLVVIAIIAILAVIGITVFSGQQATARDARRRADIQAIAQALEANHPVGAASYNALLATNFANGVIPTDTGNTSGAQYSACWSTTAGTAASGAGYNPPTTWGATVNPTVATANCAGTTWATIGTTAPATGATSWTICAKLETAGAGFFCQSNGQ